MTFFDRLAKDTVNSLGPYLEPKYETSYDETMVQLDQVDFKHLEYQAHFKIIHPETSYYLTYRFRWTNR